MKVIATLHKKITHNDGEYLSVKVDASIKELLELIEMLAKTCQDHLGYKGQPYNVVFPCVNGKNIMEIIDKRVEKHKCNGSLTISIVK